ncbi:putative alpha-1,2-mannosidase [Luteibacter sp. Sphag1AF]|uniref:GH92 family glycosyl hydrolase n=1 Tax=Luteibacter sp. Sphag1AF TaxID=2587031 RepID=UPI00181E232B|nr:putative alpha-1,2-mannosidase [Luteibacter sp. Sphag1AF]
MGSALALYGLPVAATKVMGRTYPPGMFATSFEEGDDTPALASGPGLRLEVTGGPPAAAVLTAKADVGFTGLHALRYAGTGSGRPESAQIFDVNAPVNDDTVLTYVFFPRSVEGDLSNPANYVAVDLVFDDGSTASARGAIDSYRQPLTPKGQGEGRIAYPDQWNKVTVPLGRIAKGRTVRHIVVRTDVAAGKAFEGWIDDIQVSPLYAVARTRPSQWVDTRRGSNANGNFSRGNNFPAVALPHGFNFWTPATNAGSNWIYQYQERNGADNRPRIEAFSLSHEPSPWMGDRQTFQVMPASVATGTPPLKRETRALSFDHGAEIAQPDYYRVNFDNGIETEITPTNHAAMFRFTFRDARAQLVFDNREDKGGLQLDPQHGAIQGWSDVRSRLSTGATRLFFYATFDRPVAQSGMLSGEGRDHVAGWFGFDTGRHKQVTMRVATSLISVDQARANLAQEIDGNDTFDTVRERAAKAWDAKLGIIKAEGASDNELATLYSNLYRLFLYPNQAYENTGTTEHPVYRYASPFSAPAGQDTPTTTGARVVDGKVYVNNGFWDTYRTAWPAYVLLTPTEAGHMIDGFVQQYRDGGWIARWSSPGYADLMVGTSSDVAFADAWLKGVRNFDVASFYQSALKNASVVSDVKGAGRKGIERSLFNGYTDTAVNEGLSWSMDGYINDFAIGNLARALATSAPATDPYRSHYTDDAAYYHARATGYVHLFNQPAGFFMGRAADGTWRYDATSFDPTRWGDDYTETNGWNMAFHAPQDGAGLAALYGGRDALAARLDAFFAAPGTFAVGGYGEVIHEMIEARDVRMGQYGHSNQPSHHIIWMYDQAGQPWKTQDKLRDAMSRLYAGSDIGQGYPGDEDNGEMSAWWLFGAAGFYPLRMGTPEYVIGAPYFPRMTIRLENGKTIDIRASGVSDQNRYVQSLKINGQPWTRVTVPHALLSAGATLDFTMGPTPSRWGAGEDALPASLTAEGSKPSPLHDFTDDKTGKSLGSADEATRRRVFDNDSTTESRFGAIADLGWHFASPVTVSMYALTSAKAPGDAARWYVEASDDGTHWYPIDTRDHESWPWRQQTRAFAIADPKPHAWYRIRLEAADPAKGIGLAELEFLGAQ